MLLLNPLLFALRLEARSLRAKVEAEPQVTPVTLDLSGHLIGKPGCHRMRCGGGQACIRPARRASGHLSPSPAVPEIKLHVSQKGPFLR